MVLMYLFLILCISTPAWAYIDPGTGSMLFSVVLCSVTTIFFIFRTIIIRLRVLLSKRDLRKKNHQFAVYSEGNQYFSVFKPVLDEFEKRKVHVIYYSSDSEDMLFNEKYIYIQTKYIGKGNKAYLKLAFLNADVCLMTTPQLDVLQLKRSKYVKHYAHILHSISFAYTYRLFSLDYFDSVLCDADYQVPMIREIEHKRSLKEKQLPVVGSTYMDFNRKHLPQRKTTNKYTILLAPSWGKDSLLQLGEKIIQPFVGTDYDVIIRPHPQALLVDKKLIMSLVEKYKGISNISWDFSKNNLQSMADADILITDWSGIMVDYALLFKRTFIYTGAPKHREIYDCYDLDNADQWKYEMINQMGKKVNITELEHVVAIVKEMQKDKHYIKNIDAGSRYFWAHQGMAAKNVVSFLINTQKSLGQ